MAEEASQPIGLGHDGDADDTCSVAHDAGCFDLMEARIQARFSECESQQHEVMKEVNAGVAEIEASKRGCGKRKRGQTDAQSSRARCGAPILHNVWWRSTDLQGGLAISPRASVVGCTQVTIQSPLVELSERCEAGTP